MKGDDQIAAEALEIFNKNPIELAQDIIREVNASGVEADVATQLLKRIALHQLAMDRQARETNHWLLILTVLSVIEALLTLLLYLKG